VTDPEPLRSSLEGWRGPSIPLSLAEADLGLVDLVLCVHPELRIVLRLGQEARSRGLRYPVERVDELAELAGDDRLELGEHVIDAASMAHAVPPEWLPIAHEGELLTVVHRALLRCSAEAAAVRAAAVTAVVPASTKES
jgi:hypothetical protein